LLYAVGFTALVAKISVDIVDSSNSVTSYGLIMLFDKLSKRDSAMGK
jgi:hypothetical protein